MKINWSITLMLVAFAGNIALTAMNLITIYDIRSIPYISKTIDNPANCSGSLEDIASCLHRVQGTFYNYNISNVGREMNLSQLKQEGGVCHHYANWYKDNAKALGLMANTITIDVNKSVAHEFALIYNNEGYCLMEQSMNPHCILYPNEYTISLINSSNISSGNGKLQIVSYGTNGTFNNTWRYINIYK